jgi:UDP-glucose 4-epimerase
MTFNLGSDEPISLRSLVELMVEVAGGGSYRLVAFPPDIKAIDIGDYSGDYSRIKSVLGWRPSVGLREGLTRTINYYREHLNWYTEERQLSSVMSAGNTIRFARR